MGRLDLAREALRVFRGFFASSAQVVPFYSLRYPGVVLRAARLFSERGFYGPEAHRLGILDPRSSEDDVRQLVSVHHLNRIQRRLNPSSFRVLTCNKALFYSYCRLCGLPIPQVYAYFFAAADGHTFEGSFLDSPRSWHAFIDNELPSDFVIKTATGAYGHGLLGFRRNGGLGFVEVLSGRTYTSAGIYDLMVKRGVDCILQQRVFNHGRLRELSGGDGLQTVRIWTYVDNSARARIVAAFLKIIVGRHLNDNIDDGRTGNLMAKIDVGSGTIEQAVRPRPDGGDHESFVSHPQTGISLSGFRIPLWTEACELAKEAALKLSPVRLIGWDIAVAADGPVIIEANCYSDPPNALRLAPDVLTAVAEDGHDVSWTVADGLLGRAVRLATGTFDRRWSRG
jgi:hypothetical protein